MNYIDWAAISMVPFHGWVALCAYTVLILVVYWFGIPQGQFDPRDMVGRKEVGHGLSIQTHTVNVYRSWWTEANAITGLGMVGMVVVIAMTLSEAPEYRALIPILFVVAQVVSDGFDGLACKRWDCHSEIGAFLDAARDRMALIAVAICLVYDGNVTWWVVPGLLTVVLSEGYIVVRGAAMLNEGRQLNSHGIGQMRQLIHLGAITGTLTLMYLSTLPPDIMEIVIELASATMGTASFIAAVHYSMCSRTPVH